MPESKSPQRRRVDLGRTRFWAPSGVAALTFAIIEGPSWGWRSASTLARLCCRRRCRWCPSHSYELRREGPLLDVRIFKNRGFSAGAGAIAINYFCLLGFIFLITQYFQLIRGYSALSAGVHTLPFAGVVMVATPLECRGCSQIWRALRGVDRSAHFGERTHVG